MPVLDNLLVALGFRVDTNPLKGVNHALEGINHRLELLAGLELAKGLGELVEHFSHFGDDLEQAAYQAGITAEQFQKLVYAGAQFNVGQEQLQNALAKMSRLLDGARQGSQKAVEVFSKLGISQEQLAGFNNAEDAFFAVQDALANIPDTFRRVAATQQIFGRGAVALTKFAAIGSQATRALGREAVAMGAVVSNEGVAGLAEFEDRMKAFSLTTRAFFGNMAAALAPAFKAVVQDMQGVIGANSKLASQNLDVWSERIAFALGFATETFRVITSAIHNFIVEHPKLIAFAGKTAAMMLSMSLAGGALKLVFLPLRAVFAVVSAAVGLFGLKITLAAAGISALLLGVYALWQMMHGKSFNDTALMKSLTFFTNYANEARGAIEELTGVQDGVNRDLSLATPAQLQAPFSNEMLTGQADWLSNALSGLAAANGGMAALQINAANRADAVPPLLARPGDKLSIQIEAPMNLNYQGDIPMAKFQELAETHAQQIADRTALEAMKHLAPAARR